ncbi:MAG TPA: TAXI family TRAP transporter solute-binding subunit, partial [Hyphomicrobiaceae bacterium]|nr:TAXI family TRAP transporter solute-binding subunit [Hyphomicrobiaceae bacterium]
MPASESRQKLNDRIVARLSDMSLAQAKEILLIVAPVLLLVVGAVWLAFQFVEPEPPRKIAIATGGQAGGYYSFGQRYAAVLKRHGVTLEVRPTAGSIENVRLLSDERSGVGAALMQGGITNSKEHAEIVSLGRLFLEPLWVFYRGERIERLGPLKGKRIAVGPEGSGTRHLALALLAANEVVHDAAQFVPISGKDAADALIAGTVDAVFLALAPEAPVIQSLLRQPDVRVLSFAQAEAYTRRFPFLQRIVLPQGAIDLVRNIPSEDVTLVAPVAALVARQDLHPALVGLLVEAVREVHSGGGLFHRIGDFPRALDPEFEMSADAQRYYATGPSFLRRNLPFWLAIFIERMALVAVPLAGVILPLFKLGPVVYRWRVRRRLLYWYGRLKAIDVSLAGDTGTPDLEAYRTEVARIEEAVAMVPVPLGFADQYYNLRSAIDLV